MSAPRQAELLAPDFKPSSPAPKRRRGGDKPDPVDVFADQCRRFQLPIVSREHYFAKSIGRRWRFDFAFVDYKLAVEIEGIVPRQLWEAKLAGGGPVMQGGYVANVTAVQRTFVVFGRHASVTGLLEDMEKYNTAAMLGWTVIRFAPKQIQPEHAIETTQRVLASKGWKPNHT